MDLHAYLSRPDAPTVRDLARAIGDLDPAMVRQWLARDESGEFKRRPGAAFAVAIERATGGLVRRWDTRPADWHRIWPELIGAVDAPPIPAADPQRVTPEPQLAAG